MDEEQDGTHADMQHATNTAVQGRKGRWRERSVRVLSGTFRELRELPSTVGMMKEFWRVAWVGTETLF